MENSTASVAHHDDESPSKKRKVQPSESSVAEADETQPQESEVAALNRRTIKNLQTILLGNPEADLRRLFPRTYADRLRAAGGPGTPSQADNPETDAADDFRHKTEHQQRRHRFVSSLG